MKAVTEFPGHVLIKAMQTQTTLTGEGKTPEEIQASLTEAFKLKEDKVKHFIAAIEVATKNSENLKRVLVTSLNEGESAPAKSTKVEEFYYTPEFVIVTKYQPPQKNEGKSGKGKGRGDKRGPKESPWGLSPEEKAAKNKKAGTPTT
jgi:hypothetical protein